MKGLTASVSLKWRIRCGVRVFNRNELTEKWLKIISLSLTYSKTPVGVSPRPSVRPEEFAFLQRVQTDPEVCRGCFGHASDQKRWGIKNAVTVPHGLCTGTAADDILNGGPKIGDVFVQSNQKWHTVECADRI